MKLKSERHDVHTELWWETSDFRVLYRLRWNCFDIETEVERKMCFENIFYTDQKRN